MMKNFKCFLLGSLTLMLLSASDVPQQAEIGMDVDGITQATPQTRPAKSKKEKGKTSKAKKNGKKAKRGKDGKSCCGHGCCKDSTQARN